MFACYLIEVLCAAVVSLGAGVGKVVQPGGGRVIHFGLHVRMQVPGNWVNTIGRMYICIYQPSLYDLKLQHRKTPAVDALFTSPSGSRNSVYFWALITAGMALIVHW